MLKKTSVLILIILMLALTACTPMASAPVAQSASPAAPVASAPVAAIGDVPATLAPATPLAVTPAPSPAPFTEEFFAGEWAGCISHFTPDVEWKGFYEPMSDVTSFKCALLTFKSTADGYTVSLGDSDWRVTDCSETGFTMVCVKAVDRASIDAEPPYFDVGQTLSLSYIAKDASASESMPSKEILLGKSALLNVSDENIYLVFSRLTPSAEQTALDGNYPYWFGGYENMSGEFGGMFCLGVNENGLKLYGRLLRRENGAYAVETEIEYVYDSMFYHHGPRDMRMEDMTELCTTDGVSDVFFPMFMRLEGGRQINVTLEHKDYFENEYIPAVKKELAAHSSPTDDVFEARRQLVRQGFIDYAGKLVAGEFDGSREKFVQFIPQLVGLDNNYRPIASLAGIFPGDTVSDAKRTHALHEASEKELAVFDLVPRAAGKPAYYTDGKGLLLMTLERGDAQQVLAVTVTSPGYQTPDGRQTGDAYMRENRLVYVRNGMLEYGNLSDFEGDIEFIKMTMTLDRVFDETNIDIDGDGVSERITLSGRVSGAFVEQSTVFGDYENGTVEPDDFGTRVRLSVYKNGELTIEEELPIYIYYIRPNFCDKLQKPNTSEVFIVCDTGGSGLELPLYSVKIENGGLKTKFLGFKDVYSG